MEKISVSENEISILHIRIGKNVKKYRELKKFSQLELAYALDHKSVSLISAAELYTNKKHFNLEHLYKISKIFNISLEELIK